jgi:hypothetical protein
MRLLAATHGARSDTSQRPQDRETFAKAAWLSVLPEFNPFKYNSFPINGARQTHRLTAVLQERTSRRSPRC